MSKERLAQFCDLVLNDLSLQNQLKNVVEREDFIARIIELGTNLGFEIEREDVESQLRGNRSLWHDRWI